MAERRRHKCNTRLILAANSTDCRWVEHKYHTCFSSCSLFNTGKPLCGEVRIRLPCEAIHICQPRPHKLPAFGALRGRRHGRGSPMAMRGRSIRDLGPTSFVSRRIALVSDCFPPGKGQNNGSNSGTWTSGLKAGSKVYPNHICWTCSKANAGKPTTTRGFAKYRIHPAPRDQKAAAREGPARSCIEYSEITISCNGRACSSKLPKGPSLDMTPCFNPPPYEIPHK